MHEFTKSNRKKVREMTAGQKLRYFADYYLLKVLLILGGTAFILYGIFQLLRPRPNHVLTVVIIDNVLEDTAADALMADVKEQLGADGPRDEVLLLADFSSEDAADMTRLSAMSGANEVDAVIAPESVFAQLAGGGFCQPLDSVLDRDVFDALTKKNAVFLTAGYAEPETGSADDTGVGAGEVLPYGISLESFPKWQAIVINPDDTVLGITASSPAPDNAAAFSRILTEQ